MLGLKIVIYTFIFLSCSLIGILVSNKYRNRVNELKEFKNALNIFKTKIRYTYEQSLNKLNEVKEETKKEINNIIEEKLDVQRCKYCHKYFDKGLTVCPHCRKNQNLNAVGIITSILIALFALLMLFTYFYFI